MIARDSNNNCVARALSIMRLALGYADGVPDAYKDDPPGSKDDLWILEHTPCWFPGREVLVWCCDDGVTRGFAAYAGETVSEHFDYDAHLMAFSACLNPDDAQDERAHHMVIGTPARFNSAGPSVILGVRLTDDDA